MTAWPRAREGQDGVTLVELVIVVALLSLVLGVALQTLASLQRSDAGNAARTHDLDEARNMMATLTKDLRAGQTLTATTPALSGAISTGSDVTFCAFLYGTATALPARVHLYVDAGSRLIEEITQPDVGAITPCNYAGAPKARVLGTSVINAPTLFSYIRTDGTPATTVGDVDNVEVSLSVQTRSAQLPAPTTLTADVPLLGSGE